MINNKNKYETYSSIIKNIENTVSGLTMVNGYSCEHYTKFNGRMNVKYPYFLYFSDTMNFNIKSDFKDYYFNILVFDKVFEDESNIDTIKNDTSEILNEFLSILKTKKDEYNFTLSVDEDASFFEEKFSDLTCGIMIRIKITVNNKLNVCRVMTK